MTKSPNSYLLGWSLSPLWSLFVESPCLFRAQSGRTVSQPSAALTLRSRVKPFRSGSVWILISNRPSVAFKHTNTLFPNFLSNNPTPSLRSRTYFQLRCSKSDRHQQLLCLEAKLQLETGGGQLYLLQTEFKKE